MVSRENPAPADARTATSKAAMVNGPTCIRVRRPAGRAAPAADTACPPAGSRTDASSPTGSPPSRRRANSSAAALARSAHCRSSIATTTGLDADSNRITLRKARQTALCSGGLPAGSSISSATCRARRWGDGSSGSAWARTPSIRSPSTANDSVASDSAGRACKMMYERAAAPATPASQTVVLPIPASPSSSRPDGPDASPSRNAVTVASSRSRPATSTVLATTPPQQSSWK